MWGLNPLGAFALHVLAYGVVFAIATVPVVMLLRLLRRAFPRWFPSPDTPEEIERSSWARFLSFGVELLALCAAGIIVLSEDHLGLLHALGTPLPHSGLAYSIFAVLFALCGVTAVTSSRRRPVFDDWMLWDLRSDEPERR